jgi:hypothetical protein
LSNDSNEVPFPIKKGGGSPMNQMMVWQQEVKFQGGKIDANKNLEAPIWRVFMKGRTRKGVMLQAYPFTPIRRTYHQHAYKGWFIGGSPNFTTHYFC